MTPRIRDVVLLLGALPDVLPAPETWTGKLVKSSAKRGPSPSMWVPCPECGGEGATFDRFKRPTVCPTCEGGKRILIDSYTSERVGSQETGLVARTETVRCDRCGGDGAWKFRRCELCDGTGRRSITRGLDDLERKRQGQTLNTWSREPVFDTLIVQLVWLHGLAPLSHRFVWTIHVSKVRAADSLTVDETWAHDDALGLLAHRMPSEYTVPSWVRLADRRERDHGSGVRGRWANGHALERRDTEIRKLARQGRPGQWIAREFGITPARVSQVLKSVTVAVD